MSRSWPNGAAVTVDEDRYGQPVRFSWNGRRHRVDEVCQRWRIETDWWDGEGPVSREYVAVTTEEHLLCVLYRDLQDGRWVLSRVYD